MIPTAAAVGRRAPRWASLPPARTPPTACQSRSLRTSRLTCRRRSSTKADAGDSWSVAVAAAVVASSCAIRFSCDTDWGVMALNEAHASPAQNDFRALNSALQANHERQVGEMMNLWCPVATLWKVVSCLCNADGENGQTTSEFRISGGGGRYVSKKESRETDRARGSQTGR